MFENEANPLLAYLSSVSNGYYIPFGVEVAIIEPKFGFEITLPNKKCVITVSHDQITVKRLGDTNAYSKERESSYYITCIDSAKISTGILSGLCYEFGCETYKDADATVKLIYHYICSNLSMEVPA